MSYGRGSVTDQFLPVGWKHLGMPRGISFISLGFLSEAALFWGKSAIQSTRGERVNPHYSRYDPGRNSREPLNCSGDGEQA